MKKVKIFKPSKNAMQSARDFKGQWVLEYQREQKVAPEALMGWTSSGDTLNQVRLKFETLEDAIHKAQQEGWDYTVLPAHERKLKPRNYGDNFKYRPADESDAR